MRRVRTFLGENGRAVTRNEAAHTPLVTGPPLQLNIDVFYDPIKVASRPNDFVRN